jgi:class 3 adenylate cyclase/tetratricopeptide (TPR) repeat protein
MVSDNRTWPEPGMDVAAWLQLISLQHYTELFAEQGITAEILPSLTAEDLKELGITRVGDRRRLLLAIERLRSGTASAADRATASASMPDTGTPGTGVSDAGGDHATGPAVAGERRHLTVLFCDIVGSTPLSTQLDPEEMRELLSTYQANVAAAVAAMDGYVAHVMGDGLMAYFGWPNADETHAESAVRAAVKIIDTARTNELSIRIGIASGLVVIGDLLGVGAVRELLAVGETLNLAARLQTLAEPDTIVVSDATNAQVCLLFDMEDLGRVELKGFNTPQHVWRVRCETVLSGRSEALFAGTLPPIVGRDAELDFLLQAWRQTLSGDDRVVLVCGEPGIGKSRLLAALEQRLADQSHFNLRYFCSPHHRDDTLYPVIARWEHELGIVRGDTPQERLRKLEAIVVSRRFEAKDIPLLASMLSVPLNGRYGKLDLGAQRQKELTFDMLIRRIESLARARPVLIVFEDAQWSDRTTNELLDATIDRLAGLPVLRVISFRPEFIPPWIGRNNVTLLTLGRLDRHWSRALAAQVAAQQVLPSALHERIVLQTDGIPLFIEEMTKAVLESGRRPTSGEAFTVPSTLQGSLMARLDRLPAAKQVAQLGAVIGRNFSYTQLAAIANLPPHLLTQGLDELVVSGLAFQRGDGLDAVYAFKHALVQDVAYESLLRSRRAEIHAAVVTASETDCAHGVVEPSLLGYHCAQAGLIAKAACYYRLAGERSAERAGLAETRNHLARGLQFAQSLPQGNDRRLLEAELLIALGRLLMAVKGQSDPEARDLFERAVEVSRDLGDPEMLARSLFALGAIEMSRGELQSVQTISHTLLDLARLHDVPRIAVAGHVRLGILSFYQGRLEAARDSLSRVLDLCGEGNRSLPDLAITSAPDVAAGAYLSNTLAQLGFARRAVAHAERAVGRARTLGEASLAFSMALSTSARAFQTLGDEARCRGYAEALVAIAMEHGFPQYLALGRCMLGWLTARRNDVGAGLEVLSQARTALQAIGSQRETTYVNGLMADALAWAGRGSDAISLLDETLLISSRTGAAAFDATIRLRKGVALATAANAEIAAAEAEFTRAIAIARSQSARLFELRACTCLAGLWMTQGRAEDARALLRPVTDWFQEDAALPDLREARALLAM